MSEPDLFATQEAEAETPEPAQEVPRCPECRLPMDTAHTPAVHEDWTLWRRQYRARFETFMAAWERDLSSDGGVDERLLAR